MGKISIGECKAIAFGVDYDKEIVVFFRPGLAAPTKRACHFPTVFIVHNYKLLGVRGSLFDHRHHTSKRLFGCLIVLLLSMMWVSACTPTVVKSSTSRPTPDENNDENNDENDVDTDSPDAFTDADFTDA